MSKTYQIEEVWKRNPQTGQHESYYRSLLGGKVVNYPQKVRIKAWSFKDPASITPKNIYLWLFGKDLEIQFATLDMAEAFKEGMETELPPNRVIDVKLLKQKN